VTGHAEDKGWYYEFVDRMNLPERNFFDLLQESYLKANPDDSLEGVVDYYMHAMTYIAAELYDCGHMELDNDCGNFVMSRVSRTDEMPNFRVVFNHCYDYESGERESIVLGDGSTLINMMYCYHVKKEKYG
tara:strand:- start:937 stop:1329 length:393 start_codon:yes stop_codon:yes gene_type:complete